MFVFIRMLLAFIIVVHTLAWNKKRWNFYKFHLYFSGGLT